MRSHWRRREGVEQMKRGGERGVACPEGNTFNTPRDQNIGRLVYLILAFFLLLFASVKMKSYLQS